MNEKIESTKILAILNIKKVLIETLSLYIAVIEKEEGREVDFVQELKRQFPGIVEFLDFSDDFINKNKDKIIKALNNPKRNNMH